VEEETVEGWTIMALIFGCIGWVQALGCGLPVFISFGRNIASLSSHYGPSLGICVFVLPGLVVFGGLGLVCALIGRRWDRSSFSRAMVILNLSAVVVGVGVWLWLCVS
jgi:hypothetical protein